MVTAAAAAAEFAMAGAVLPEMAAIGMVAAETGTATVITVTIAAADIWPMVRAITTTAIMAIAAAVAATSGSAT